MSFKRSRQAYEAESNGPPQHAPYALYGTPLPAFDSDARDDGSYVPVWKQEVTDERGRKRLHGAFTGGWSAGYFNTVGSKEGWTPSTFVSSRTNRAKDSSDRGRQQRAEDFMDDEDLAEQAEAQQIETQHAFAGIGGSDGPQQSKAMFADIFRAVGESKGAQLLQKMGWRQGQGIGPKVWRRADGDKTGEFHLFAPEDSKMIAFVKKNDHKGLGYAGEDRLQTSQVQVGSDEDSGDDARILRATKPKNISQAKMRKKTGFGVGVLNDGSDDEDPYSLGPRISQNRIIGADKKKKKAKAVTSEAASNPSALLSSSATKKLLQRSATTNAGFRRCHDGRLPLDGFVLSMSNLSVQENAHPPPEVPAGWISLKLEDSNATTGVTNFISTADAAKASMMDPNKRAAILGEQRLPGKSIFDYMSPDARERLAELTGRHDLLPAKGEQHPESDSIPVQTLEDIWNSVPHLDKQTANAALHRAASGWTPYSEDTSKQARYKKYLAICANPTPRVPGKAPTSTRDDWIRELQEFKEAAEIFRPISGLMATRFVSSTTGPALASDAPDRPSAPVVDKEEEPAEKAAKMGMYGALTRSRQPFYPPRLLCKRFNVKPPPNVAPDSSSTTNASGEVVEPSRRLDLVSQSDLDKMMLHANLARSSFVSGGTEGGTAGVDGKSMSASEQPPKVDAEKNDVLESQKPGAEIFKAIFGSDDEDDE